MTDHRERGTQRLPQFFGSYKAESLRDAMFDVFIEPAYFPMLATAQPCVLIGGRGTGKTTALRGLSYKGQFSLSDGDPAAIDSWEYFGIYHRINTSRVTAFRGDELAEDQWVRLFSHYMNLILCERICEFIGWFELTTRVEVSLDADAVEEITTSLNIVSSAACAHELRREIRMALIQFEASINSIADGQTLPKLSMPGAPIDLMIQHLQRMSHFRDRMFFFILDEYENLEDYQQRVLNTYIKHSGEGYSFKIGVRELGLRQRTTLRKEEQLIDPADYHRIDIVQRLGSRFSEFAASVIGRRLKPELSNDDPEFPSVKDMFPSLTIHDEARLLGVSGEVQRIESEELSGVVPGHRKWFSERPALEKYIIALLARGRGSSINEVIEDARGNETKWARRVTNYGYAALFTIRRGKRGIPKYYAGWTALALLAAGNIRYLLQLVTESLALQLQDGNTILETVSPANQTRAAQETGRKNLQELEGLSVHGARLTKLVLALGRVFQVMATHVEGHTPEVNQFYLRADADDSELTSEVDEILSAAVMHLALLRYPGSKLQDRRETRAYDYALHPVFAPYFGFSHRRKRKIKLRASEVLGLIDQPSRTIDLVLETQGRPLDTPLPDQLKLFEEFYVETD